MRACWGVTFGLLSTVACPGQFRDDTAFDLAGFRFVTTRHGPLPHAVGDVDLDGLPDVIVTRPAVSLLQNDKGLRLVDKPGLLPSSIQTGMPVELADFDGDGAVDLLTIGGGGVRVYRNTGGRGFTDQTALAFGASPPPPGTIAIGDVDLPGAYFLPDGTLGSVRNDGHGVFSLVPYVGVFPFGLNGTIRVDLDADGDIDLIEPIALGEARMLRNVSHDLKVTEHPQVGGRWSLLIAARPDHARIGKLAWGGVSFGSRSAVVPGLGVVHLDPASFVPLPPLAIPAPRGRALLRVGVPNDPAHRGLEVWAQFGVADPEGRSFLTNVVRDVIL